MIPNLELRQKVIDPSTGKKNFDIVFRNFAGEADKFNPKGNRTFTIRFNIPEDIEKVAALGWKVKVKQYDETDPNAVVGNLQVKVNFENERKPPVIKQIALSPTGEKIKTTMTAATCSTIDSAEIENVKIVLNASEGINSNTGLPYVTAYLKTMHYNLVPDEFDQDEDERDAIEYVNSGEADLPFDA